MHLVEGVGRQSPGPDQAREQEDAKPSGIALTINCNLYGPMTMCETRVGRGAKIRNGGRWGAKAKKTEREGTKDRGQADRIHRKERKRSRQERPIISDNRCVTNWNTIVRHRALSLARFLHLQPPAPSMGLVPTGLPLPCPIVPVPTRADLPAFPVESRASQSYNTSNRHGCGRLYDLRTPADTYPDTCIHKAAIPRLTPGLAPRLLPRTRLHLRIYIYL